MATKDKCYCSRAELKKSKAANVSTAADFAKALQGIQCTNTIFSCGWTRSWVTEVFEGTASDVQFNEAKHDDGYIGTNGAGYTLVTGDQIITKFTNNKSKTDKRIVY